MQAPMRDRCTHSTRRPEKSCGRSPAAARSSMHRRFSTDSSTGVPVIGTSRPESGTTKCSRLPSVPGRRTKKATGRAANRLATGRAAHEVRRRSLERTKPDRAGLAMEHVDLKYARRPDGTLHVALAGEWKLGRGIPAPQGVIEEMGKSPLPRKVIFETGVLASWDSGLLTFLSSVLSRCTQLGVEVDRQGLPEGVRRLLALASAVPARAGRRGSEPEPVLARVGNAAIAWWIACGDMLAFIGEAFLSLLHLLAGKARFRRSDFLLVVQDCGARSLPIVALINLLVGLILAFVGAIELRRFGAEIYVADLVGIGMLRDIAPIMTGIIVTGRTGASFAAQLGTMEANQEIDALRTLGIPPMDFLVLPRLLALSLMMPLLCLYADLMGVAGGLVVGGSMLGISPVQ